MSSLKTGGEEMRDSLMYVGGSRGREAGRKGRKEMALVIGGG